MYKDYQYILERAKRYSTNFQQKTYTTIYVSGECVETLLCN